LKIDLVPRKVDESSEWVVIIGAAGAVGSFAVQVRFSPNKNGYSIDESYRLPTYVATKFWQLVRQVLSRYALLSALTRAR
jgi:hypothetical protein